MKIAIESTEEIVHANGVECRLWKGHTERGIELVCLVARIAVAADADTAQFDAELLECQAPRPTTKIVEYRRVFPTRLIL